MAFKEGEKERIRKAVQTYLSKKKKKNNSMTPEDFYRKKEASWIKALRNKVSTENSNKEKAKAILKVTKKPSDPYNNRQSFSKTMNNLRSKLPTSPWKQAAVVAGLASEYGHQVGEKKQNSEKWNKRQSRKVLLQNRHCIYHARKGR